MTDYLPLGVVALLLGLWSYVYRDTGNVETATVETWSAFWILLPYALVLLFLLGLL